MVTFGILGINARNLHYVGKYNPEKAVRLADNKITTKEFLSQRGIPLPATYAVIKNRKELAAFDFSEIPHTNFVIKPARGSRGRGIFLVKKLKEAPEHLSVLNNVLIKPKRWTRFFYQGSEQKKEDADQQHRFSVQGQPITESLLKNYCLDILDGRESLQGRPDHILIEEFLVAGDGFEQFCAEGLADIRVIVYNFVPVAAMVRVPTEASQGKANLDRGGIGLGVEVGTGNVQSMFLQGKVYKKVFPDKRSSMQGVKLSYREDILQRSTQIQYYVNLGYLALDRVITDTGPKLLEINARAGLKIQLALDMPLRHRLEKIGDLKITSPEKGVEICQSLFSHQKIGLIGPNKILPQHGYAVMKYAPGVYHDVSVTVDLKKTGVSIDRALADLSKKYVNGTLAYTHEQIKIPITKRKVDTGLGSMQVVLGADMIKGYLIRPIVQGTEQKILFRPGVVHSHEHELLRLLDNKLAHIGSKLVLSRYLKPQNFLDEFDKFLSLQGKYNPTFTYQRPTEKKLIAIGDQLSYLHEEFREKSPVDSPLIALFAEKLTELQLKKQLLLAYRNQNLEQISVLQGEYRGAYDQEIRQEAEHRIAQVTNNDRTDLGPVLGRKSVKREVMNYLVTHGREDVEVKFTPETFARMSVKKYGSKLILQISSGSTFRKLDLYAALAHELLHIQRYVNGAETQRQILRRGTARYFVDEEGLAIWTAEQELPDAFEKVSMRKKYLLVDQAMRHNFVQMSDILRDQYERSLLRIFKTVYRLKRGIQHTTIVSPHAISLQDTIYAAGYRRISTWIQSGGDIEMLMRGKIKIDDLHFFVDGTQTSQKDIGL